jgi:transcriptional regulator GlxA family with amidase domain
VQRVIFLILPEVDILDLGGPLQVFHEANSCGADYELSFRSPTATTTTNQGLVLGSLEPLGEAVAGDLVIVTGIPVDSLQRLDRNVLPWLRRAHAAGARLCSICTGAFALGEAGLLDGRQCTTHWKRTEQLQQRFPRARVITNRLFVEDRAITTSAGIASGIDLALSLVERQQGPRLAAEVAREMVVYLRRDASHKQESVYLDYRAHLEPGIHRVQDVLTSHPEQRRTLQELAGLANMSERNLTRVFRQTTGISIGDYVAKLRVELARTLLADPRLTLEAIAARCGFESARQLRRTSKKLYGSTLSTMRRSSTAPALASDSS